MSEKTIVEAPPRNGANKHSPKVTVVGSGPPSDAVPGIGRIAGQRFLGDWEICRRFPASGGEADIYLVRRDSERRIFKLYRWGIQPKVEVLDRLIGLGRSFPHLFVQVLDRGIEPESRRFFEMEEFFPEGSLRDCLPELLLQEEAVSRLFTKLSNCLLELHKSEILHLDLKPDNILVRSREPLDVVLTDFGISSILDAEFSKKMTDIKGTSLYQSPESLSGVVGVKSDWWSLGIVLLELLTGKHPFAGLPRQTTYFRLTTAGIPIPPDIPDRWRHVLKGLLTRNPQFRWGEGEVREWLSGANVSTFFDKEMAGVSVDQGEEPEAGDYRRFELPFAILGRSVFTLEGLMRIFASTPDLWNQGKILLTRGRVADWLEESGDPSRADALNLLRDSEDHPDKMLFKAIYTFNSSLHLAWCGCPVDKRRILEIMAKACDSGVHAEEEELLNQVFVGGLFKDYTDLVGRSVEGLTDMLRLGKSINSTELRKLPLGEKSRILLFALQSSYSPEKALDSLGTALQGDREFELILKSVGAKGFREFAFSSNIWEKGDEATWQLAEDLFSNRGRVAMESLGIICRMSYVVAHSIGRDRALCDLLNALALRADMDQEMFARWENLREQHFWLNEVARISYKIPNDIDCRAWLVNMVHSHILKARWKHFEEFLVPPFFFELLEGNMISESQLAAFQKIYPKPWLLAPKGPGLAKWHDLGGWLFEIPSGALKEETYQDLMSVKQEYSKKVAVNFQAGFGLFGMLMCLLTAFFRSFYASAAGTVDYPTLAIMALFSISVVWPKLRNLPGLENLKGRPPLEQSFPDPQNMTRESSRPINWINRIGLLALVVRLILIVLLKGR